MIRARARTYARDRVVCGVHYPSDIEAGRLAGLAIIAAMRDDARYQEALVAARLELRHALGLPLQPVSGAGGELRSGMHPDAPASAWRSPCGS